jgi:hypothetical protein
MEHRPKALQFTLEISLAMIMTKSRFIQATVLESSLVSNTRADRND